MSRFSRRFPSRERWASSNAVDFSFDFQRRYTFWSGLLGGFFLALSYFGTDQSQVQRYLAGGSLAAGRFGLLFNAVLKLPMQFFILFTGVMVFVFFQFEKPPLFFNQPAYQRATQSEQARQAGHSADSLRSQSSRKSRRRFVA